MDRQDDKSADVCDAAVVPATGRTLQPVMQMVPQLGGRVPLPLTPSAYGLITLPFARPCVAATLPPAASLVSAVETGQQAASRLAPIPQLGRGGPVPVTQPRLEPSPHNPRPAPVAPAVASAAAPFVIAEATRPAGMVAPHNPVAAPAPSTFSMGAMTDHRPAASLAIDPLRRPGFYEPGVHGARSSARQMPDTTTLTRYAKLGLKIAGYAAAGWLAMIILLIFVYRFVNPPMSSLMLQQTLAGESLTQTWTPIEDISPQVVRAVLLSEDGRFCQHYGVDFDAMQDAIERAGDGSPRGASTISMQVTKNLFLWPSKSYIRKAIEIPLTWAIELVWPKRRIMEIYLNIAEWGPGIFGVEAASHFHFQKSASRLNEREAAQLAVALPNPYIRDAGDPGPKTRRLASDIQARMRHAYSGQTACVLPKSAKRR